ncbi:MAG: BatD family protein [Gammaproteobacteria bacterium]|nr:BatD family protein [Gammaproteobacteria bacterium]
MKRKPGSLKQYLVNLVLLGLALVSSIATAKISQTIDREEISAGETFVFEIQVDNNEDTQPDLSLIPGDFTIVSTNQYQHTRIINGASSTMRGWKIKLSTLKTGKITLPSITVGNEATQPIQLNIKSTADQVNINGQDKAIFLTAEVDVKDPYIQQQVILDIKLYRSVATHFENMSAPLVNDAIMETLGSDVIYEKEINNTRYMVYQSRYAIFPQKSGEISISPIIFSAEISDPRNRRNGYFLNATRPITVSTEKITLNVKPQPASVKTNWLPAKSVEINKRWSRSLDELKVGEPVTLTIDTIIKGISESQLPEITFPDIEGLQLYPDTPEKERKATLSGLVAKKKQIIAVLPTKSGKIELPEIKLHWWNTDTQKAEVTVMQAQQLDIVGNSSNTNSPSDVQNLGQGDISHNQQHLTENTSLQPQNPDNGKQGIWQLTSVIFAILWLSTLVLFWFYYNRNPYNNPHIRSRHDSIHRNVAKTASDRNKLIEQTLQSWSLAKENQQKFGAFVSCLLSLVNLNQDRQYYSLGSIAQRLNNSELKSKLNDIEKRQYSATQQSNFPDLNKQELLSIIEDLENNSIKSRDNIIPSLY